MPQPRRDAIHRYYTYDETNLTNTCKLCGKIIKGKHTTNLKNHYSLKHLEEYLSIKRLNEGNQQQSVPSSSRDNTIMEKVKNSCCKLITIHGRPLALLQDKAFQDIINIAVPANVRTKHININSIKAMIQEKAYEIKLKIAAEVRHKLISLKLDSATYLDRNLLGINLQFIREGKIIIRNLAVLEMLERQTGESLKEKFIDVLNEFMISANQIYSITTDNASNFKKMTKLVQEHCLTSPSEDFIEASEIQQEENEDLEEDIENENGDFNVDILLNSMQFNESQDFKPRQMLCAAHTLQLAVSDAIAGNIDVQITLDLARKVVKILRRPNMKSIIKIAKLNKPLIDCPTRWASKYLMLVRLTSLKDICESHTEISNMYSETFWSDIADLVTCLKPVYEATLGLQRDQLTISDFFIEWLTCKAKVESIGIQFSNELGQCMKAREVRLLNTELILENLYLDGRLNIILSDEESLKAQALICETHKKMQSLQPSLTNQESQQGAASTSQQEFNNRENSSLSILENILRETEVVRGVSSRSSYENFESVLYQLRYEPRVPLNEDVLTNWENKKETINKNLFNVAQCVLATPATQVSVERLFSSLKFILNPLRSNINGNLLKDIMLIRSNDDLYQE